MIKKDDIKMWKKNLPQDFERMAVKYLYKRVTTYMNAITSHTDSVVKAKADIYRHLIRHTQQIVKLIAELEKELIEMEAEVFFPLDEEKVHVKDGEAFITDMKTNKDWSRAFVQGLEEEKEKK